MTTPTITAAFADIWADTPTAELRRRVDTNVAYIASGQLSDPEACATEAGFLLAEILRREVEG